MLAYLLQGLGYGAAAAAQPGPFQAFLLARTLRNGWLRTLPAALAPLISDGPIIVLVLLLLTQMPAWFVIGLRFVGGGFLLYLAWGAYRSVGVGETAVAAPAEGARRGVLQAALMNALSPNPYIFWATVTGPILLEGWRQSAATGVAFLLGFYGALIGGFAAFVLLFAISGRLDPRLNRILGLVSAVALCGFALYQFYLGTQALLT
ncbi:MAG: LysE family transporter [Anaerolineales bacterium]|nr:LysE family transporter [Anaerolineales bacterium]